MGDDLRQNFEDEFAKPPSQIEQQAALAALGDEYPAGLETYSWVSRTELRRAADVVREVGGPIADVGCGRGGPGLWVAGVVGAPLIGIDIADTALVQARALAETLGVAGEFRAGTFEETGLADDSVAAVLTFDAFLFTPDKQADFLLDRADDLAREGDEPVADVRAGIAEMRATIDCMRRRFLLVAQRPTT